MANIDKNLKDLKRAIDTMRMSVVILIIFIIIFCAIQLTAIIYKFIILRKKQKKIEDSTANNDITKIVAKSSPRKYEKKKTKSSRSKKNSRRNQQERSTITNPSKDVTLLVTLDPTMDTDVSLQNLKASKPQPRFSSSNSAETLKEDSLSALAPKDSLMVITNANGLVPAPTQNESTVTTTKQPANDSTNESKLFKGSSVKAGTFKIEMPLENLPLPVAQDSLMVVEAPVLVSVATKLDSPSNTRSASSNNTESSSKELKTKSIGTPESKKEHEGEKFSGDIAKNNLLNPMKEQTPTITKKEEPQNVKTEENSTDRVKASGENSKTENSSKGNLIEDKNLPK